MYGWHKPLCIFGWHYNIYVPLPFNKTKICMCTYSSSLLLLLRFFFAQIFRMPRMTLNGNLRNYLSCSMSFEFTLHRFPLLFSIFHFSSLINVQIICKNKTLLRPIIKLWLMCNFNYYINHHNCNPNARHFFRSFFLSVAHLFSLFFVFILQLMCTIQWLCACVFVHVDMRVGDQWLRLQQYFFFIGCGCSLSAVCLCVHACVRVWGFQRVRAREMGVKIEPTKDNNWMHSSRNYLACVYKWKP